MVNASSEDQTLKMIEHHIKHCLMSSKRKLSFHLFGKILFSDNWILKAVMAPYLRCLCQTVKGTFFFCPVMKLINEPGDVVICPIVQ